METLGNLLWILVIVAVLGLVVKTIFFPKKSAPTSTGNIGGGGGGGSNDGGSGGGSDNTLITPRNQEPQ